ncbi:ATP-dependent RNA helicase DHX30, partial [Asbolus verrucosus]
NDKFYTSPKNILHNAYDVIAQECNNRDLKLQPHYNIVKEKKNSHFWCCTYYVKWPETIKFVSVGPTKQEASHKAALSTLLWLRKKGKITKEGYPVFIGKNEVKEITKTTVPNLSLDHYVLQKMNLISDIYQHEFIPKLTNSSTNEMEYHRDINELNSMEESEDNNFGKFKPKLLRNSKYFAKEKVHLPISEYKQQFINLLKHNRIVIVQGEPGCGKSTRIPQYVLEAWAQDGLLEGEHCCLAVTQPRRIAAISLADRVSSERDERCGHIVGYQVRLKSNFNPATGRILYCTTGILLRHLQSDITLSHFTHVILDEAHERDVNTDLLMNLLRNTIKINPKLKLIVMSATIDTDMFKNYFNDAAVMHIPGFTYPVKYNFIDDLIELDLSKSSKMCSNDSPNVVHEDVLKLIHYIHKKKSEGAILCFLPGWEDISKIEKSIPHSNDILQDSDQWKIFSKAPPGVRKVILSTNIAETSVTINDVVYVIDTAIHKENRFDNAKDPEILKTSLTKIVLNSKIYSNNMDALEFMSQLPSPPEKNATRRAVAELKELELLDDNENLTSLGKTLANFQLEPKLAKILVNAIVYKCVTPVVDIVTLFAANTELFATSLLNKENIKNVKSQASKDSDHLAMMRLFETWLELMEQQGGDTAEKYCSDANLVHHKLITMNKLRKIHFDYLYNGLHNALPIADDYSDNNELIKAVLLSGVGTLLKRCDWDIVKGRYKKKNVFLTSFNQKASITSESVNFKRSSFPEAASLKNCKEALNSAYQYFIFQMTEGGECNLKINEVWNKILE